MASSIKSTPTENWDDDFLFQLTPSRPLPSRSRTTGPPRPTKTSAPQPTSSAFGTYGRGSTGDVAFARPLELSVGGRKMREHGSGDSDLDGFFSDEDVEVTGDQRTWKDDPSTGRSSPVWNREDDEPIENWDEDIVTSSARPGSQGLMALGTRTTSTPLGDPPFLDIPIASGSGLGIGYKKNASQSDLHDRVGGFHDKPLDRSREKEKKKEYRKSYHGPSGSSGVFKAGHGEMRVDGPLPPPLPRMGSQGRPSTAGSISISPPPRRGSSGVLMPPPTSYPRIPITHPDRSQRPGIKETSSGGRGTIMERVVSLHKRFSSSSTSGSRSDLNAMASTSGGRPSGLKVDTSTMVEEAMMRVSSDRLGRVGSPVTATTPRLNESESTRSIHSLLSSPSLSSSSTSANLQSQSRLVPDGLPTHSGQARSGSSSHTSSPSLVSAGFHLPSPSPASPYYQSQARFQSPEPDDEEEEALEDEEDEEKTPRRRNVGRASMEVDGTDRQVSASSQRSGGTAGTVGTAQTVYMMDERERDVMGIKRDEERMKGFKMGGYQADQLSALQKRMGDGDRVLSPAGLPLPVDKKRKSTLKRLSSMGKRHGRKVSDGWRLVSGSSGNSNSSSTTAMFERKSSDSQYVSTPKTAPVSFRQQQMDRISPPRTSGVLAPPFTLAPPLTTNFAPSSVRSMKQTPSSSSSRISSDPQAVIRASNLAERNDGQQRSPSGSGMRRVSLSDLKIPSRVASAQKGVKEGMMNAKQFHESIKELKCLVARRAVLDAEMAQTRTSSKHTSSPNAMERNLEAHWELAILLIALGDTGIEEDDPPTKRERRITLASGRNSPAPLSPTEIPLDRPSRSNSKSNLGLPVCASASEPVGPECTGTKHTSKRTELTERQLELLRGILDPVGNGRTEPTPPTPRKKSSDPVRSTHRPMSTDRDLTSGRSSIKENVPVRSGLTSPDLDHAGMRLEAPPNPNKMAKRRSSRSGFFNLRDMWRTSSGTGNPTPPPRSPLSPEFDIPGRSTHRPEPPTMIPRPIHPPNASSTSSPPTPTSTSTRNRFSKPPTASSGARPGLAGMFSRRSSMSSGLALSREKEKMMGVTNGNPIQTGVDVRGEEKLMEKKDSKRKSMKRDKEDGRSAPPPVPLPLEPQPSLCRDSSDGIIRARDHRGTRSSTSSSTVSDWDRTPSPEPLGPVQSGGCVVDDPSGDHLRGARKVEVEVEADGVEAGGVEVEVDKDRTIGRSDSRRMLASLGVRPEGGSPGGWSKKGGGLSTVSQAAMKEMVGQGRSVTGARGPGDAIKTSAPHHPMMVLAPENLGPLTSAAKEVVERCRESLRLVDVRG